MGQLVVYFNHENRKDLAHYTNQEKEKKKFDKEIAHVEKNNIPMRISDVRLLYESAKLEDKVLIRLLLLESLPIRSLGKIFVRKDSKGDYDFNDGTNIIRINEETVIIAKPLIERNISNGDKGLLGISSTRQIETRIHAAGEKINLSYKITPKDLRKFGYSHHPDDLIEMLSTAM